MASLIVDAQEQQSSKKTERIKARIDKPKNHRTRSRLVHYKSLFATLNLTFFKEERKEALAAQVNRAKREKAKSRKTRAVTGSKAASSRANLNGSLDDNAHLKRVRKSVTFA